VYQWYCRIVSLLCGFNVPIKGLSLHMFWTILDSRTYYAHQLTLLLLGRKFFSGPQHHHAHYHTIIRTRIIQVLTHMHVRMTTAIASCRLCLPTRHFGWRLNTTSGLVPCRILSWVQSHQYLQTMHWVLWEDGYEFRFQCINVKSRFGVNIILGARSA